MSSDLMILKWIHINAEPAAVWDVLVNPEKISQYFTGAETITNWLPGSEILFIHQYQQQEFINKGIILNFETNRLLRYTYWTAFSGTEDKPENYTTITYTLTALDNSTELAFSQANFKNIEWYKALETGWDTVLAGMKEIAEKQN